MQTTTDDEAERNDMLAELRTMRLRAIVELLEHDSNTAAADRIATLTGQIARVLTSAR